MAQIIEHVDVGVPIRIAYDQWTQFESFPEFLDEVESITQLDDTNTRWKIKVGGAEREFDAAIAEQHPDERVAWTSTGGHAVRKDLQNFKEFIEQRRSPTGAWRGDVPA